MAENTIDNLNGLTEEKVRELVQNFANMGTMREIKGISDQELEAVYSVGFNMYRAGNFAEAEKIFQFLTLIEHTSSRFWTAFGSAQQAQKKFAEAVKSYQMGSFLDLENPKPMYYAAECFFLTGDKENALMALASLEQYAPQNETGRRFKEKGAVLKKIIEAK